MKEDKYIWEEFKKGKDYALSYIYHQNIDFLYFFGKKITKDENIVLDSIQDLFYELIRSKETLGETDNIRLYLLKSLRRKLIRELQKRQKQEEKESQSEIVPVFIFSIEEDLIGAEENDRKLKMLRMGMQELNEKQREILFYRYHCGYDYRQIGEIMSISNDCARQLVSRSILFLKTYFIENKFILMLIFSKIKKCIFL